MSGGQAAGADAPVALARRSEAVKVFSATKSANDGAGQGRRMGNHLYYYGDNLKVLRGGVGGQSSNRFVGKSSSSTDWIR